MNARLILVALMLGLFFATGCDTTDSGGSSSTTMVYYGGGFYDPWYYDGCYDCDHNDKVVINPPPGRGDGDWGARPSHPIADGPSRGDGWGGGGGRPSARPMPSIPSTPRPSPRGGGGRGGRGR